MSHFKIIISLICSINLVTSFFQNYRNLFELSSNKPDEAVDETFIYRKWIEQPLDHFNQADNRTFKMRYFERTSFFKEGKPIFVIVDGTRSDTIYNRIMVDLANETNGAIFAVEIRYSKESLPFDRLTTKNLKYLTTRQILADIANFLKFIKSSPKFSESKVVVAGAGDGGRLSTWMRLKYPDLVDAAYASSAPVLAKLDNFEWAEKIGANFKQYGSPGCWDQIAKISANFVKAFQTEEGREELRKELHLCDYCDMVDTLDQQAIYFDIWVLRFDGVSSRAANISKFKDFCDSNFTSKYSKTIWKRNDDCGCYNYKYDLEADRGLLFDGFYRQCTEYGFATTTSSDNQPFTKFITMDYFSGVCEYLYGPDFNITRTAKGVEETCFV